MTFLQDRLSANRQREVAWDYRMKEFCPMEALPGFAFHQVIVRVKSKNDSQRE